MMGVQLELPLLAGWSRLDPSVDGASLSSPNEGGLLRKNPAKPSSCTYWRPLDTRAGRLSSAALCGCTLCAKRLHGETKDHYYHAKNTPTKLPAKT